MKDLLDIYIDRLPGGKQERFEGRLSADSFFDDADSVIHGSSEVEVAGKAYIASDFLIIQASIKAPVALPCTICNKMTDQIISIKDHYLTKPLEEIPHKVFSLKPLFREAILLQLSRVVECKGNCPERAWAQEYMRPSSEKASSDHPFADL